MRGAPPQCVGALRMLAHSAGVSVRATNTDSAMAATMVMENWR